MSTTTKFPIQITIGDTETLNLTFQNADGSAINIAGRTYAGQLRATAASDAVVASFVCAVVGDGSTGEVVCSIPSNVTASLQPQVCVYDIQETNGSVVTTLLRGDVKILQDVTR